MALANTGKIYAAPADASSILEIDPTTRATQFIGNLGATSGKYFGGVPAPNGNIYFIPHAATQVLEFNPKTYATRLLGSLGV